MVLVVNVCQDGLNSLSSEFAIVICSRDNLEARHNVGSKPKGLGVFGVIGGFQVPKTFNSLSPYLSGLVV